MALLINSAAPAGSDSPALGDDQIRAFKLAIQDIFGVPNNTSITNAVALINSTGLQYLKFNDQVGSPAASGRLSQNGVNLEFHNGTAAGRLFYAGGTDVPVADGGTGLSSGTSGGILGYTASGTLASSAALTASALMLGGGAGATPTALGSLGTTTTVLHGNAAGAPAFSAIALSTDVSGTVAAAQFPALTGDITTSAGSLATTLANTGPGATGPLGSATVAPIVTIDAKGRVTALSSATITIVALDQITLLTCERGADTVNDILVNLGAAVSDDAVVADRVLISLTLGLTKQLDAAWAVGTNAGGLDTGVIANTTYHVFLIKRSDTGAVDVLFSASPTAPSMPANYDKKRRIGSFVRAAGANRLFTQDGDTFLWVTPINDVNQLNPGTAAVTVTLSVPTGIVVEALVTFAVANATTAAIQGLITALEQSNTVPSTTLFDWRTVAANAGNGVSKRVRTNTSAQVRTRQSASGASDTQSVVTHGWIDRRGRG